MPVAMPMPAQPAFDASNAASGAAEAAAGSETIGFATGGAQDVENFRCAGSAVARALGSCQDRQRPRAACRFLTRKPRLCCRENIEANYLPLPTDLTFGGLSKDYYFDTYGCVQPCPFLRCLAMRPPQLRQPLLSRPPHTRSSNIGQEPCTDLFCPIYSVGLSPDPLVEGRQAEEFYMVG